MLQAVFTDNTNYITVSGLTQWDYGQKLEITLAGLPESFEAHFAYRGATEALVVKGTAVDGVATVPIPNILTTQKNEVVCWLYYKDGESGETVKTILLPIKPRQKPTDYVYTETEVVSYTSLLKRVEELENNGASDDAIASAVAKWLEENPIESGNGKDGVGIQSVEQTTTSTEDGGTNIITVTKTDGTKDTFQVKNGSKGSKGDKGDSATDEQVASAVEEYLLENPVSGLSVKEKETLLALFKSVEYTGDMSATIKRLEALFAGEEGISYTITYNLTNVTSSDSETTIVEGSSKTITLTADEGFLLDVVTVTMNGEDITSSVYSDGVISITSATGNIVITASAVNANILAPVYALAEETVFDGTNSVDTGYRLFDEDKDWSIELEVSATDGVVFAEEITNGTADTECIKFLKYSGWYWRTMIGTANTPNEVSYTSSITNAKYVLTRSKGENTVHAYIVKDSSKIAGDLICAFPSTYITEKMIGKTNNLLLGHSPLFKKYLTGTIHDFKIYERVLETTEINEYLGV